MAKTGAMKLIISFVERGQGNDLAKFYAEHNVQGRGTHADRVG